MLPPDEPDSSSYSEISSSSSSTSLPTTFNIAAATAEPSSGMFAAILGQLRAELAEERRRRETLEARQRQLALHLYWVVEEQIRGVKAMKKLVQSVREGKEDDMREMVAVMKRMKDAWRKKSPRNFIRKRWAKKSN